MSSPDAKLTNPPKGQTEMVAAKGVKIKALYPIRVKGDDGHEKVIQPGETATVSADEAKEFCDKKFDLGQRKLFGNYDSRTQSNYVAVRAERV